MKLLKLAVLTVSIFGLASCSHMGSKGHENVKCEKKQSCANKVKCDGTKKMACCLKSEKKMACCDKSIKKTDCKKTKTCKSKKVQA